MQIWDTAGQDRFKTITRNYFKGAKGIILTYSITDKQSFINVENWMKQVDEYASKDVCKLLIANKTDMPDRVISKEEGQKIADQYGIPFFETSALENQNIETAF